MNSIPHSFFPLSLTYPQMDTKKPFVKGTRRKSLFFHFSCVRFNFLLRQSRAYTLVKDAEEGGKFMDLFCIISYSVVSRDKCCECVCSCLLTRQIPKVVMSVRREKMRNKPRKGVSCMRMNLLVLFSHFFLLLKCFIMILLGHLST